VCDKDGSCVIVLLAAPIGPFGVGFRKFGVACSASELLALRHSFVSLLIEEGRDFREVARLAGHGPEVCARKYAHLFDEWDGAERVAAEEAIRRARQSRRRRAS
jgi:hypothetical protein